MLWQRLRQVLSRKTDREFSVKMEQVTKAVSAAKESEAKIYTQLAQLEMALKNGRK